MINTGSGSCDLYAQANNAASNQYPWLHKGLPDLIGTGCVKAPDWPKRRSTCWSSGSNTYPFYNSTPFPICTNNGKKNALNMIRIGIIKDHCDLPCCNANIPLTKDEPEPNKPEPIKPE